MSKSPPKKEKAHISILFINVLICRCFPGSFVVAISDSIEGEEAFLLISGVWYASPWGDRKQAFFFVFLVLFSNCQHSLSRQLIFISSAQNDVWLSIDEIGTHTTLDVICWEIRRRWPSQVPGRLWKGSYIEFDALRPEKWWSLDSRLLYSQISHETLESIFPPDVHWKAFKKVSWNVLRENWLLGWLPPL